MHVFLNSKKRRQICVQLHWNVGDEYVRHIDLGAPDDLVGVEGINCDPTGVVKADPSWPPLLKRAIRAYNSAYNKGASRDELAELSEWVEEVAIEVGVHTR